MKQPVFFQKAKFLNLSLQVRFMTIQTLKEPEYINSKVKELLRASLSDIISQAETYFTYSVNILTI